MADTVFKVEARMDIHTVTDHAAAFDRLDEGLKLALEQAEGDPAMLAWLIGATLVALGQQGYLDAGTTATIAGMLGQSVPREGTE